MARTLRAIGIGAAAALVTLGIATGSAIAIFVVLGLAKVLGRYAVLAFFVVMMGAAITRPSPDHGHTSLTHGTARVVAFSLDPGVADWPALPIFDSFHQEDVGFFADYLRPRGKDDEDVAVSIWGEGSERDPFGITLRPRSGPLLYATDGGGCAFDLLSADPKQAFAGTVRCDRMETDGSGPPVDLELEVRFTASP